MRKQIDPLMKFLGDLIEESEKQQPFINWQRVQEINQAYSVMEQIIGGEQIETEKKLHQPWPSCGSISVRGKEIVIEQPKLFYSLMGLAQNFEVYPMVDGNVSLGIAFTGLTQKEMV